MKTINNYRPFHFQYISIQKGLEIIENKNSLLLASETGLGKTIVAATIALNANPKNVLVISPKANQKAWQDILNKSGLTYTISGNRAIPNYKENFDFVIIDEVHKIGTVTSSTYQSIFKLVRYNRSKLINISATPYNNNIEAFIDIISLFNLPAHEATVIEFFAGKIFELDKEISLFRRIHGETIYGMSFSDIGKLAELKFNFNKFLVKLSEFIAGFSIRDGRSTIKVLETEQLLERFPTTENIEFNSDIADYKTLKELAKLIDSLTFAWQNQTNYFIPNSNNEFGSVYRGTLYKLLESSVDALLSSVNKSIEKIKSVLQQDKITIGETTYPVHSGFTNDLKSDLETYFLIQKLLLTVVGSPKVDSLFNAIEQSEGKFIVFTEYVATLEMLAKEAEKRNISFIEFKSDTDEKVLDVISAEFDANNHKSDKYKVLICNDVLAEGVSLHYAKHLVHYDSKWNPSRLIQREGRINRICMDGNNHDIKIYKFTVPQFVNSVIELTEKIERKTSESDVILNGIVSEPTNYISTMNKIIQKQGGNVPNKSGVKVVHFVGEKEFILFDNGEIITETNVDVYPYMGFIPNDGDDIDTYFEFNGITEYSGMVDVRKKIDTRFRYTAKDFGMYRNDKFNRNSAKITALNNYTKAALNTFKDLSDKDVYVSFRDSGFDNTINHAIYHIFSGMVKENDKNKGGIEGTKLVYNEFYDLLKSLYFKAPKKIVII